MHCFQAHKKQIGRILSRLVNEEPPKLAHVGKDQKGVLYKKLPEIPAAGEARDKPGRRPKSKAKESRTKGKKPSADVPTRRRPGPAPRHKFESSDFDSGGGSMDDAASDAEAGPRTERALCFETEAPEPKGAGKARQGKGKAAEGAGASRKRPTADAEPARGMQAKAAADTGPAAPPSAAPEHCATAPDAGCAQLLQTVQQLQERVAHLEQQVRDRDAEIGRLRAVGEPGAAAAEAAAVPQPAAVPQSGAGANGSQVTPPSTQ